MESNIIVDFTVIPAKAKCVKCGQEVELEPKKHIKETMAQIKQLELAHKDCK